MLSRAELFARLAEGHAARVAVVTPNKRLSQALMADFDEFQIKNGLAVWEAPDILPFDALVERLWEDALYSDLGETLPLGLGQLPLRLLDLPHQVLNRRVGFEHVNDGRENALSAHRIVRVQQLTRGIDECISLKRALHRVPSNGSKGLRASLSSKPSVLNAALM